MVCQPGTGGRVLYGVPTRDGWKGAWQSQPPVRHVHMHMQRGTSRLHMRIIVAKRYLNWAHSILVSQRLLPTCSDSPLPIMTASFINLV